MKIATPLGIAALACLATSIVATPATAALIAPQPIPVRVAQADMVVTGKVTKIEDKTVSAPAFPGVKDNSEFQIAIVKIDDALLGAKGLKEVRVGFPVQKPGIIRPGGARPITLTEDEEVCLFLTKHFDADFYTMPYYFSAIKKANNTNYETDVMEAKKAAKLLADPLASLKAKENTERYLTAAMLIERYRTQRPHVGDPLKQEPIDAAESKLILEALRDADWTPAKPGGTVGSWMLAPDRVFGSLGLTAEDKWTAPADASKHPEAAQAWLKDNADTYRIRRFVVEKKDDAKKDK